MTLKPLRRTKEQYQREYVACIQEPGKNKARRSDMVMIWFYTTVSALSPSAIIGTPSPRSGLCNTSCSCLLALR